jgi:hypothetical protein
LIQFGKNGEWYDDSESSDGGGDGCRSVCDARQVVVKRIQDEKSMIAKGVWVGDTLYLSVGS